MELRLSFMHWVSYVLVFATISISKANYDAHLAMKIKELDMNHTMKTNRVAKRSVYHFLSSRQPPPSDVTHSHLLTPGGKISPLPTSIVTLDEGKTRAQPHTRSTRCTTSMPLPKLHPLFIPSSSDEINDKSNFISVDDKGSSENPNKYIAPTPGENPHHYIDDEK